MTNDLILDLITTTRRATPAELGQIIAHVSQAPFASYLSRVPKKVRRGLKAFGMTLPASKMKSVEWHLLQRIYIDLQWPIGTTEVQFVFDLHQAILHPQVQIWTYRYYNQAYAGFLAPSHVQNVPKPLTWPIALFMAPLQQATKPVVLPKYLVKGLPPLFNIGKTMYTQKESELDRYTNDYIENFLYIYDLLIDSAPELAAEWHEMDDEEHGIQRCAVISDWEKRHLLGDLYCAGRLTRSQEERLAELDNALLEHAGAIEIAYGPSPRLLTCSTA